jgi:hypothetical protein
MIAHTKPHVLFSVVLSDLVLVDRCMVWRFVKLGVGVGWETIQLSESMPFASINKIAFISFRFKFV